LVRGVLGGVAWNIGGSAVLVVAQIASTAATARLVAPREFGLYATAQAATGVVGYFTMTALGHGVQRRSNLTQRAVGTALTLSLASSFVVSGGLLVCASLWASAWGVPEAAPAVRVIALALFLTSAAAVPIALLRRHFQFGRAEVIETGSLVIAMGAGVALAIEAHSALALASGQALGAAALLVAAGTMTRDELRLSFDRAEARELFTFASQVSGLTTLAYFVLTAPAWFTARVFGASVLGLYSRAYMIVAVPATYASHSLYKVLYPLYGRIRDDRARTRAVLDEGLTLTTGIAWPLFALIAGAAPVVVTVLLGSRWDGASSLVPLLALAACAYIPCGLLTNAAEAMGWMRIVAARQLALLIGVITTLIASYAADLGLTWVLAGVAAVNWAAYLLTLSPFVRRSLLDAGSAVREQAIHAGVALAVYGLAVAVVQATAGAPLAVQVGAVIGAAILVFGALAVGRSWFPAGGVLSKRLAQVAPERAKALPFG
jgi:PST family polysaccharide transporter